jgi:hypothetical protein
MGNSHDYNSKQFYSPRIKVTTLLFNPSKGSLQPKVNLTRQNKKAGKNLGFSRFRSLQQGILCRSKLAVFKQYSFGKQPFSCPFIPDSFNTRFCLGESSGMSKKAKKAGQSSD